MSEEYDKLHAAIVVAEGKLESAIEKDKSEAEGFWTDLWRKVSDPINYRSKRRDFDSQVEALVSRARNAIQDCKTIIEGKFYQNRNAIKQLSDDRQDWQRRSDKAATLAAQVRQMKTIEGWAGASAEDYAAAVEIQSNAMLELAGVIQSAAGGAHQGRLLNLVVYSLATHAVKSATEQADQDMVGGGDYYYCRTAWWGDMFTGLPDVLQQIRDLKNVEEAVETLNKQLGTSLTVAELLEPGSWPTGLDASGLTPGPTGAVVRVENTSVDYELPTSGTPGVCTAGTSWG